MNNEELTSRVEDLGERVTRHTEQIKTAFNQISELKAISESIHKLATSVELLAHDQKDIGKKVDGLVEDVDEIKDKPGKRWDSVVGIVITVVVTAAVTFALARIGLG